jgi:murein DD-endopeptidase MepM/ murein hydrolase activator NlpD
MSRSRRYVFNPLTLSYEVKRDSNWTGLVKSLSFLVVTLVVTILILVIQVSLGFDLPKTAILRKKNARLTSRVTLLNRQLEQHNKDLYALQVRDDGIYRAIFGMNAIPDEVRNAGFSGVNRYSEYDGTLKDAAQKMDRLMKKTYIQSKSFDEVSLLSKRMEEMVMCIPAIPPMVPDKTKYRPSSPFGWRFHPIYHSMRMHTGVDLVMDSGTPLYSTGDGVVHTVKSEPTGYGRQIVIDHGFGYKTRYAHMQKVILEVGTPVKRGDCVGLSGNSGSSTGAHLHYEVLYKNVQVNPANYYDLSMTPEEYMTMIRPYEEEE